MSGKYSADLISTVRTLRVRSLGQDLAYLCIEGNLPAAYVAQVLGVTRVCLHLWFRGSPIKTHRVPKIEAFMRLVKDDLIKGVLPAQNLKQARNYLQEMCDEPLKRTPKTTNG